jgi:uncharacterized membrane protein YeaQ/YmgE (transglycosylase-associated protein family)
VTVSGERVRTSPEHLPLREVNVLGFIISMLVIGLVAGFLARAIVPGRDPMSLGATIVLGIVGSYVGGLLGYLLLGKDAGEGALQPSGIVGALIGAIIALLVWRRVGHRDNAHV